MQLETSASAAADAVDRAKLAGLTNDKAEAAQAMLDALRALAELAEEVTASTDRAVGASRTLGIAWQDIGKALGISRQAAHARFNGPNTGGGK